MDDSYFGTGTTNYTKALKGRKNTGGGGNPRDIMIAYHTKALKGRKIITVAFGNVVFRPFRAVFVQFA